MVTVPAVVVQRGLVEGPIADRINAPDSVVAPLTAKLVSVPTLVSEEFTTVEFNVVPLNVSAGAITTLELAAVIRPLPFTVIEGIAVEEPKLPTSVFTVAKVRAKLPAVLVTSPVCAGSAAVGNVEGKLKTPSVS